MHSQNDEWIIDPALIDAAKCTLDALSASSLLDILTRSNSGRLASDFHEPVSFTHLT